MSREKIQQGRLAAQPYEDRAVGRPPELDFSTMTKEQLETRRDISTKLRELTKKAEVGDKKARTGIRDILQEHPDLAWKYMDYGKLAEWHMVERMTKDKDFASKEVLTRQLSAMREEVAGKNPSPLERLLAERVVATWLQIQLFEGMYAASMEKSMSIKQGIYFQKLTDRAHRNHISAIRTLAQIRKMGPAVQINIAEQQINTAG